MIRGIRASALLLPVLMGCGPYSLDQGDTLNLSFEPGLIFISGVTETTVASFEEEKSCQNAGGSVVHLSGIGSDGRYPDDITAVVWLSSATDGQLLPIQEPGNADQANGAIHLQLDDEGTASACYLPGTTPGTVSVSARSGVVETSNTLTVRERAVPVDGALTLTVTPPDAYLSAAATAGACGAMIEDACTPGRSRQAAIAVVASAPQSGGDVPESAEVILTTDKGWLTLTNDCAAKDASSQQVMALKNNAATASLCLDDTGGTVTLTAVSGTVTTTKSVVVPALPSAIVLSPSAISTTKGTSLTLAAHVRGCDGKGIGGLPVSVTISEGSMTFETPQSPIQITKEDGTISLFGTVIQGPLKVKAYLSTLPTIECATTIEVKP